METDGQIDDRERPRAVSGLVSAEQRRTDQELDGETPDEAAVAGRRETTTDGEGRTNGER